MNFILKSLAILCVFEGNSLLAQTLHDDETNMQGHSDLVVDSTDNQSIVKNIFQKDQLSEQDHQTN